MDNRGLFGDKPTRVPFDPELVPVWEQLRVTMPRFSSDSLSTVRQMMAEGFGRDPIDWTVGGAVDVRERDVPGPEGSSAVPLLILSPTATTGPLPVIFHIHGGGMVVGDRRSSTSDFLKYVADGTAIVVSPEYRLAPEHPAPAPADDCFAALLWVADNAAALGVDSSRFMIAGLSAGGGLAAGTALRARDRGLSILTHQMLLCPMLDDRFETHSSRMLDGVGVWDRNDNLFGWDSLLGAARGGSDVSAYAAPSRATDLSGLPRTFIDVGSAEGFRDEAVDYAQRLSRAGVSVDLHVHAGGFHGYEGFAPHAAVSRTTEALREDFVRRAFEG